MRSFHHRYEFPRLPKRFGMFEALAICFYSFSELAGGFCRWIGEINRIRHSVHYDI